MSEPNNGSQGGDQESEPTYQRVEGGLTADQQSQRLEDQLQIIKDALGEQVEIHVGLEEAAVREAGRQQGAAAEQGAAPAPSAGHAEAADKVGTERTTPSPTDYLCRKGRLLTRDADRDRVERLLDDTDGVEATALTGSTSDPQNPRPSTVNGLTIIEIEGLSTEEAVALVDRALGVGVVTPDHVLHVTANACCPATEPEPPGRYAPDPDLNTDPCTSGKGVLVSIVDTGLLTDLVAKGDHPWLNGVVGDPEIDQGGPLRPYLGHGTFIAGIVRAMAPKTDVTVDGFLPKGGAIFESEIIRQLGEALDRTPDIISLSAGAWTRNHLPLLSFQVFWETRLRHLKGTVLVAAAGNDGSREPFWPAAFPWSVSVGALDASSSERAPYSNYGSWVDVWARGSEIVNAFPNGVYEYKEAPHTGQTEEFKIGLARWSGTSFATPIVSGLIAARMSRTGESARDAAEALKRVAAKNAKPGVGPILRPGMASQDSHGCGPDSTNSDCCCDHSHCRC